MKTRIPLKIILVGFVVFFFGCSSVSAPGFPAAADVQGVAKGSADEFIVVDCMLPGQVRKLGRMVYQTPRRPIKTTTSECEIKGGEYVAYDRSDLDAALAVWMEKAGQGDAVAQTYVGEIYQKGVNGAPRYDQAVKWFSKAAAQDYSRAQFNLGYLYEQGLGVPQDNVKALNLYRRASGLSSGIVMDSELVKEQQAVKALQKELERREKEAGELRRQLEQTREQSRKTQGEYESVKQQIGLKAKALEKTRAELTALMQYGQTEEVNDLQDALADRTAELKQAETRAAELEKKAGQLSRRADQYQSSLSRYQDQSATLQKLRSQLKTRNLETEKLRRELSQTQEEMVMVQQAYTREQWLMDQEKFKLEKRRRELENLKNQKIAADQQQLTQLSREIEMAEAKLAQQHSEADQLKTESQRLGSEAKKYRTQIAGFKEQARDLAGPKLEIIDPKLLATRSLPVLPLADHTARQRITGRVTAPAGLLILRINDKKYQPKKNGLFSLDLPLEKEGDTIVNMVAVDTQGKSDTLIFSIPSEKHLSSPPATQETAGKVDFGAYYALLIGNNAYQNLPELETAANDAKEFGKILAEKYGFKTRVLLNATREEIYAALDDYRRKLTEKDNFLLYYAGHGEMDPKNRRGYWLPVDADLDSHINSIPNYTVTDIFNIMSVKQAIIISDTCYSGIMTRSAVSRQEVGMSAEKRLRWLRSLAAEHSRTVLTSGGLMPVLDAGIGNHSIFAKSLLDVLAENDQIIEASRLYREIRPVVISLSKSMGFKQVPQYAANLHAGHQSGDFLFVPVGLQKS